MKKYDQKSAEALNAAMPANANALVGSRVFVLEDRGLFTYTQTIPAGTAATVTPLTLDAQVENRFDFEVLDVVVRTETSVASSTVQLKKGTDALTDAIISAVQWAVTRAAQVIGTYNKFYPASDPAGYSAAPLNIVDAGGATAAARTVTIYGRRI